MPVKIDQDVLEVLARCEHDDKGLLLPEQLDRKLYLKVNKALEAAGFKWAKGVKRHLRDGVDDTLDQILLTGEYVDEKKEFEAFYTPPETAERVRNAAGVVCGMRVLEPSAGDGALLRAITRGFDPETLEIIAIEKNEAARAALAQMPFLQDEEAQTLLEHSLYRDFLEVKPGDKCSPGWLSADFDRVVMNPPFSRGQDAKHVLHALKFLKPGGRLVAIMSAGVKFRTDGPYREFIQMFNGNSGNMEDLPEGSFKASGTNVNTVMVTIDV